MTTQAERLRRRSRQLDARDVFIHAHFVAAQASSCDSGVNRLAFGLVLVAGDALRRVDVLVERNRVLLSRSGQNADGKKENEMGEAGERSADGSRQPSNWRYREHHQPGKCTHLALVQCGPDCPGMGV